MVGPCVPPIAEVSNKCKHLKFYAGFSPWEFDLGSQCSTQVLQFLSSKMEAAGVCKTWWKATGAFRSLFAS